MGYDVEPKIILRNCPKDLRGHALELATAFEQGLKNRKMFPEGCVFHREIRRPIETKRRLIFFAYRTKAGAIVCRFEEERRWYGLQAYDDPAFTAFRLFSDREVAEPETDTEEAWVRIEDAELIRELDAEEEKLRRMKEEVSTIEKELRKVVE